MLFSKKKYQYLVTPSRLFFNSQNNYLFLSDKKTISIKFQKQYRTQGACLMRDERQVHIVINENEMDKKFVSRNCRLIEIGDFIYISKEVHLDKVSYVFFANNEMNTSAPNSFESVHHSGEQKIVGVSDNGEILVSPIISIYDKKNYTSF